MESIITNRKEFRLTELEFDTLLDACEISQEAADAVWRALGRTHSFFAYSVKPIPGKDRDYFTAVSTK